MPSWRAAATTGANISSDSSTVRLRLRRAKVSVALANTAMSRTPAGLGPLQPGAGWEPGPDSGRLGCGPSSGNSSSASPSCGTQLGRHEAGGLDRRSPAATSRAMNSALVAVGTHGRLVLQAVAGADLVDLAPGPAARAGGCTARRLARSSDFLRRRDDGQGLIEERPRPPA